MLSRETTQSHKCQQQNDRPAHPYDHLFVIQWKEIVYKSIEDSEQARSVQNAG